MGSSGGGSATRQLGTTLGATTLDGSNNPVFDFDTHWGIDGSGNAYYNSNPSQIAAGEKAVALVLPGTNTVLVYKPGTVDATKQIQMVADGVLAHDLRSSKHTDAQRPTGALAETYQRGSGTNTSILNTGRSQVAGITLTAGQVITSVTFFAGTTGLALNDATHQWAFLMNASRTALKVTNDDTTVAWTANGPKTFTFAGGAYTVPTTGLYYVGLVVVGTVPTLICQQNIANIMGAAPILAGTSTTTLTDPASAPSPTWGAISIGGNRPYAYVS